MVATLLAAGLLAVPPNKPIEVRVLVVNYNPVIESEGGKRLHQVLGWNDPRKLAEGYIADLRETSRGFVRHRIIAWRDVDEWPQKVDGFRYTDESFLKMWRGDRKTAHQPDEASYKAVIDSQRVNQEVERGRIDELWVFGFPYGGFWESAMVGPGAFFINGGTYPDASPKKRYAVMGFSYERGVAEMIHNLCHRAENHLRRVYGGRWDPVTDPAKATPWERFSAYEKTSPGHAGVGNCHFPPNGEKDYDYANPRTVTAASDDWLKWPNLKGVKGPISKDTWGGPDYQRNYLKWWYTRLPNAPGKAADGRQLNWWKYIYQFNNYDELGR